MRLSIGMKKRVPCCPRPELVRPNSGPFEAMKLAAVILGCILPIAMAQAETLKLAQTIPLPRVEGRIDHLSLDAAQARLFVAALGNDTVEVVDLKTAQVARSLHGFSEPQGVLYLAAFDRLYVANGGDGTLTVLDGTTFAPVAAIKLENDADNIRYDDATKQLYVGYGTGALAVIDVEKNTVVGTIPLTSHPESFQIETAGTHIFVNVPRSHAVTVADRTTRKAIGSWSLGLTAANFPLALDETHHRAFVACRAPARLLVFDTISGKKVAQLDLHGDCDDVFYDAKRGQLYASCGEGFIDVFTQTDADHYTLKEAVKTPPRARTCLLDGAQLYLAVPRTSEGAARILVYDLLP